MSDIASNTSSYHLPGVALRLVSNGSSNSPVATWRFQPANSNLATLTCQFSFADSNLALNGGQIKFENFDCEQKDRAVHLYTVLQCITLSARLTNSMK